MVKDPCKSLIKEAKKKAGSLKLSKDLWSGGLLYLQAAECYNASGDPEKAYEIAMKAANLLRKYASKYGYGMVIRDIEKALKVAYRCATGENKDKAKKELFFIMNLYAKELEMSGNYLGAADKYKEAIEFAPTGEQARDLLTHAIQLLEKVANQKILQGKDKIADRILEKIDEIKALIPMDITEDSEASTTSTAQEFQGELTFSFFDIISKVIENIKSNLENSGLPISNFNIIEHDSSIEVKIDFLANELTANMIIEGTRIILSVNGKDPETAFDYMMSFRDLLNRSAENNHLVDIDIREGLNLTIVTKLLKAAINQCKIKCTYGETLAITKTVENHIAIHVKSKPKLKDVLNKIKKLNKKLEKAIYLDQEISEDELIKILPEMEKIEMQLRDLL